MQRVDNFLRAQVCNKEFLNVFNYSIGTEQRLGCLALAVAGQPTWFDSQELHLACPTGDFIPQGDFLEKMMIKLGFHTEWVRVVMRCVTTVSYCFKVNGELIERIIPWRGLKQGDPLSPYLFLICAEGFSCLLNAAEERGDLNGVKICPHAPIINHLLLLLKNDERSAQCLQ